MDIFFSRLSLLLSFSLALWETARYRLEYCLKGPLSPKQPTNQLYPACFLTIVSSAWGFSLFKMAVSMILIIHSYALIQQLKYIRTALQFCNCKINGIKRLSAASIFRPYTQKSKKKTHFLPIRLKTKKA